MISPVSRSGFVGRKSDGTPRRALLPFATRERMNESSLGRSSGMTSTAETAGFWTLFVVLVVFVTTLVDLALTHVLVEFWFQMSDICGGPSRNAFDSMDDPVTDLGRTYE